MTGEPLTDEALLVRRLHSTTDARVWAEEFMKVLARTELDESLMIGWFANAMQTAISHERRHVPAQHARRLPWRWRLPRRRPSNVSVDGCEIVRCDDTGPDDFYVRRGFNYVPDNMPDEWPDPSVPAVWDWPRQEPHGWHPSEQTP